MRKEYGLQIKVNHTGDGKTEYVAQYLKFPTVIGVGDSPEEALSEAQIFLEEYLEYCSNNGIVVEPDADDEWMSDYSGKITVRLPKSLHRDISDYAEKDGMSINSLCIDAIRFYLMAKSLAKITDESVSVIWESSRASNNFFNAPSNPYVQFEAKLDLN